MNDLTLELPDMHPELHVYVNPPLTHELPPFPFHTGLVMYPALVVPAFWVLPVITPPRDPRVSVDDVDAPHFVGYWCSRWPWSTRGMDSADSQSLLG